MKKITTLVFIISFIACSKNNELEKSSGTKLISIEYTDDNDSWIENYSYSPNNKLEKIEDFRSLGRRYEIDYQNDILKEYTTFVIDENKLAFRDSILYNSNGTIMAIHNFSINVGTNLPLSLIYEYEYDNENRVSKKSTYFVTIEKYISVEKYYWKDNNIDRVEYYNGDEELYYEYFYKYDDKKNYSLNLPTKISSPINWSENNVTEMNWNDYVGNLDIICRPCKTEYKYNLDDFPVSMKLNWGREMKLNYE